MAETQKSWFALEITVDSNASEAVEFALNELDALGTEINNLGKKQLETLKVVGYFNEKLAAEDLTFELSNALKIYGFPENAVRETEWREVEDKDWLAEWKKHWRPTETARFIIAPTWEKIAPTDKIVVRIEPSMAFGTGTHETTRLCLRAIEQHYRPGESLFDVGTGTGILAIAAAKFSGPQSEARIAGCDTDEDSIKIARENAEMNFVPDKVEFFVGSISDETPVFDFVCANLTADVILSILPQLIEKAKRMLVLSGILREQEDSIISALEKLKIGNYRIETDGEWIAVRAEKQTP